MPKLAKSAFISTLFSIAEAYDPTHYREHFPRDNFVSSRLQKYGLPVDAEMRRRVDAVVAKHFTKKSALETIAAVEYAWEHYDALPEPMMPRLADGPIEPVLERALEQRGFTNHLSAGHSIRTRQ